MSNVQPSNRPTTRVAALSLFAIARNFFFDIHLSEEHIGCSTNAHYGLNLAASVRARSRRATCARCRPAFPRGLEPDPEPNKERLTDNR
jgi:hypothetical protein